MSIDRTLIGTSLGGRRRRRDRRRKVQCLPNRSRDRLPLSLREISRAGGRATPARSLSQRALMAFFFSLFKPVLPSLCVYCPRLFVEREVLQRRCLSDSKTLGKRWGRMKRTKDYVSRTTANKFRLVTRV